MKKAILVATCVAALSAFTTVGASAQTTGPAGQDNSMKKDDMSKDGMSKDGMKKDGMETTGMKKDGMTKEGMSKDMSKDGSPKADPMKKGN
jgi:pentapeptide MXKDX repeat protein